MKTLVATSAAVTAAAAAGGLAAGSTSTWYDSLRKPPFQPPAVAFPIAWTALYASIAAASATTIDTLRAQGREQDAHAFEAALAANLALNAGWTWTFFRAHRPWLATAHSAVLVASSADLARRAGSVSRGARAALAPYVGWTSFATVLSGSIAWLNRRDVGSD